MSRWEEIRQIHKTHRFFYEILGGAVVLVISVLIGAGVFGRENVDYRMNLFTEGMGIVATVFMINRWYAYREQESLKRRLIREAGSRSHDIAISAVEWMEREGWLRGEDGLLKGANLREARLEGARMDGANLEGANLERADLRGAKLNRAILNGANLVFAKAEGAVMNEARLEHASLNSAVLDDAYLECAQLEYATLSHAKLRSAKLDYANFGFARMLNVDMTDSFTLSTNFFKANLHEAKLEGLTDFNSNYFEAATLTCVDLRGVDLEDGQLKDADLRMIDLRNSNLLGANLQGANLYGALLEGAHIWLKGGLARLHHGNEESGAGSNYTEFWQRGTNLSHAVLPDGSAFSDEIDDDAIERFTDRNHPEFSRTLAKIEEIREVSLAGIDYEMMFAEFGDFLSKGSDG